METNGFVERLQTDLDQRQKEIEQLITEKDKLSNIFDNLKNSIPSSIIMVNKDNIITDWNEKAEELFGLEVEKISGADISELGLMKEGRLRSRIDRCQFDKKPSTVDSISINNVNGDKHLANISHIPLLDEGEEFYGTLLVIDDVTKSAEISAELQRKQADFESLNNKFQEAYKKLSLADKEIEVTNEKIHENRLEIEQKNNQITMLNNEIQKREENLLSEQEELQKTKHELEEKTQEIHKITTEFENIQKELEEKSNEINQIQTTYTERENEFEQKNKEFERASSELEETKWNLDKTQTELQQKQDTLESGNQELQLLKQQFEEKIDEITESIKSKSIELDNVTTKLNRSRSALEGIEAELCSSDEEMTRMWKEKIALYDEIDKELNHDETSFKTKKLNDEDLK